MRYEWMILQQGRLPLRPNGLVIPFTEHRCTSVLVWPEGQDPSRENTVIVDPCFTSQGFRRARRALATLGLCLDDMGRVVITHAHEDHRGHFPGKANCPALLDSAAGALGPGLRAAPCPGHSPDLRALVFRSISDEEVWIVGDAVLDVSWLKAWKYYWPNAYGREEIIQTWRSAAVVLSHADVIVPGHGEPIRVTSSLIGSLLPSPMDRYDEERATISRKEQCDLAARMIGGFLQPDATCGNRPKFCISEETQDGTIDLTSEFEVKFGAAERIYAMYDHSRTES